MVKLSFKGVDLNRNYGFHWNEGGSSSNPCDPQTYHGPKAWSEIETQSVRDYILKRKGEWIFYNSIHSFAQVILLPWAYTATHRPSNFNVLKEVADKGVKALKMVHGKTYGVIIYVSVKNSVFLKTGGHFQTYVYCKWHLSGLGIRSGKDTLQLCYGVER